MKRKLYVLPFLLILTAFSAVAQDTAENDNDEINTLFSKPMVRSSGGYGAVSNKFTRINGHYANLVELYGGWYINHRFLLGISGGAITNDIPVPPSQRAIPGQNLSYMYSQFGLMTEYALASNKTFHLVFQLMAGSGFTIQYDRNFYNERSPNSKVPVADNWFFVAEPGVQLEVNVFKWMRFSPGYSYRAVYGSNTSGLSDNSISGSSFNATFKFGKF